MSLAIGIGAIVREVFAAGFLDLRGPLGFVVPVVEAVVPWPAIASTGVLELAIVSCDNDEDGTITGDSELWGPAAGVVDVVMGAFEVDFEPTFRVRAIVRQW